MLRLPIPLNLFIGVILYNILFLSSITAWCQKAEMNELERMGDQYFAAKQYFRAGKYYMLAHKNDSSNSEIVLKLAHSMRFQFKYAEAAKWFKFAQKKKNEIYAEAAYFEALMLKTIGQCGDAVALIDSLFISSSVNRLEYTDEAKQLKMSCLEMNIHSSSTPLIQLLQLDSLVNSPSYDYAPMIIQNDSILIFTSNRFAGKQKLSYRFGENKANFFSYRKVKNQYIKTNTFADDLNTKSSEGSGCFVSSKQEFYFTSCSGDQPCQIQFITFDGSEWSEPEALSSSVNSQGAEAKHPSLSISGDTLFFSSDRAGGHGGLDIWMSMRMDRNQWSMPVCLDTLVNSEFDEATPFLYSQENVLYFASNNPTGYGGMDLYAIVNHSNSKNRLRSHLPLPFNSTTDDSYLTLGTQTAFLSSNRQGDFDIYSFNKNKNQTWYQVLHLEPSLKYDQGNSLLPPQLSSVIDRTEDLGSEVNDWIWVSSAQQKRLNSGATRFILNSNVNDIQMKEYQLQQRNKEPARALQTLSTTVVPDSSSTMTLASFSTDSIEIENSSSLSGVIITNTNSEPLAESTVELRSGDGELLKITTTNELGEFKFVNILDSGDFTLSLTSDELVDTINVKNFTLTSESVNIKSQTYEPIYFDFNQDYLRTEAEKVLEELAQFYLENPQISIEINAYTDSLGNDVYNLLLSKKRGETAFNYLIQMGVDRSALAINAQGVSTAYTSTNAYVSQQLNRRVEFEIFSLETSYSPDVITRILRPKLEMSEFLNLTQMSQEALDWLNGRKVQQLNPYKPIRVYKNKIEDYNSLFYQIIDLN